MEPRDPSASSPRLLHQVTERARYLHYSLSTEKAYLYWVRFFVRWHGMRHPRDMGPKDVEAFLAMLANERRVSTSTHNQALSAILFLYREVLGIQLLQRAVQRARREAGIHKTVSAHTLRQYSAFRNIPRRMRRRLASTASCRISLGIVSSPATLCGATGGDRDSDIQGPAPAGAGGVRFQPSFRCFSNRCRPRDTLRPR